MEIEKKIWPEYFEKVLNGGLCSELRLADFELQQGDTLILREYNPKTEEYTGRELRKKVKNLIKFKPTESYSTEDMERFGLYQIDLE